MDKFNLINYLLIYVMTPTEADINNIKIIFHQPEECLNICSLIN